MYNFYWRINLQHFHCLLKHLTALVCLSDCIHLCVRLRACVCVCKTARILKKEIFIVSVVNSSKQVFSLTS